MFDITHLHEQLWIKLFCLALGSNLEVCPHSRELFSYTFKRYARSLHHVVFYRTVIKCQSYAFQDYVLSGLFSSLCCWRRYYQLWLLLISGSHFVSGTAHPFHFQPHSGRSVLHVLQGNLIVWSNQSYHSSALKHGIIFALSCNWSADPPCSNHG